MRDDVVVHHQAPGDGIRRPGIRPPLRYCVVPLPKVRLGATPTIRIRRGSIPVRPKAHRQVPDPDLPDRPRPDHHLPDHHLLDHARLDHPRW